MGAGSGRRRIGAATFLAGVVLLALWALAGPAPGLARPLTDDPAADQATFTARCSGCHAFGRKLMGPDLQGVAAHRPREWLVQYIADPQKLRADGDPIAKQLAASYPTSMPTLGLTAAEAETVVAYLETQGGAQARPSVAPARAPQVASITGDAAHGRRLFLGTSVLQNGGPACVACHDIAGLGGLGGGKLARDLTGSYARYGPETLVPVLQAASFPVMRETYAAHPITAEEAVDLRAFLARAAEGAASASSSQVLLLAGLGGFVVFLGIALLAAAARTPASVFSSVGFLVVGLGSFVVFLGIALFAEGGSLIASTAGFLGAGFAGFTLFLGIAQLTWRRRLTGVRRQIVRRNE